MRASERFTSAASERHLLKFASKRIYKVPKPGFIHARSIDAHLWRQVYRGNDEQYPTTCFMHPYLTAADLDADQIQSRRTILLGDRRKSRTLRLSSGFWSASEIGCGEVRCINHLWVAHRYHDRTCRHRCASRAETCTENAGLGTL